MTKCMEEGGGGSSLRQSKSFSGIKDSQQQPAFPSSTSEYSLVGSRDRNGNISSSSLFSFFDVKQDAETIISRPTCQSAETALPFFTTPITIDVTEGDTEIIGKMVLPSKTDLKGSVTTGHGSNSETALVEKDEEETGSKPKKGETDEEKDSMLKIGIVASTVTTPKASPNSCEIVM